MRTHNQSNTTHANQNRGRNPPYNQFDHAVNPCSIMQEGTFLLESGLNMYPVKLECTTFAPKAPVPSLHEVASPENPARSLPAARLFVITVPKPSSWYMPIMPCISRDIKPCHMPIMPCISRDIKPCHMPIVW